MTNKLTKTEIVIVLTDQTNVAGADMSKLPENWGAVSIVGVRIPGYAYECNGVPLVLHHTCTEVLEPVRNTWTVSEPISGRALVSDKPTRAVAMDEAAKLIAGIENFAALVFKRVAAQGEVPERFHVEGSQIVLNGG
jgi:hypothetical protein